MAHRSAEIVLLDIFPKFLQHRLVLLARLVDSRIFLLRIFAFNVQKENFSFRVRLQAAKNARLVDSLLRWVLQIVFHAVEDGFSHKIQVAHVKTAMSDHSAQPPVQFPALLVCLVFLRIFAVNFSVALVLPVDLLIIQVKLNVSNVSKVRLSHWKALLIAHFVNLEQFLQSLDY